MPPVTAIALSGGIDSMVAAALLKDQGRPLIALHFLTGYETGAAANGSGNATMRQLEQSARRNLQPLADQLDIPLFIIDLRKEFKSRVVAYFVAAYDQGVTPNPCLVCNPLIKFDILYNEAVARGARRMASGHYARIDPVDSGRMRLRQGVDAQKDQSYFLSRLSQTQLARIDLPLGSLTKAQTRRIALDKALKPISAQESQDVCFIKEPSYDAFLSRQPGFKPREGPIEDVQGRPIGRHQGLHRFTIGQRRGINCPADAPYYVVRLDHHRNCLVVGGKTDLLRPSCRVSGINWIAPPPASAIRVSARIRYRHRAVAATLDPIDEVQAEVRFDQAQSAVTPGQGAVFYSGQEVLGGGWIQ
ncbi:MAG: tRNA 2-thiouridine(34) synthase MnmA [Desulfatitalea sp.]|nr:tRNA 2-thiouridine(34) synthase MnmA [Desulfatitalea sp.]NNK01517.1 tRNA 2-thiouridine(34) synthase MnmA [Desulfatitalea sp.]